MSVTNSNTMVKFATLVQAGNEVKMKLAIITVFLLLFSRSGFTDEELPTREVLLDNQSVMVIRLTYPAGTESGMHTHVYPHRVVYTVNGGTLELVPADPQVPPQSIEVHDGDITFVPASTHNVKNVGDTRVVLIETELKNPAHAQARN